MPDSRNGDSANRTFVLTKVMGRFRLIGDFRIIAAVYAVTTLIASWHKYVGGGGNNLRSGNNLRIFRSSFVNLVNGRDLYGLYPEQYWDHFNYSPTFALLMAPFAWLPEFASALFWNFCNVFALFAAVCALSLDGRARAIVLWLVGIELLTSIQNFQSNALVAALIIATLVSFERGRPELAAVFVALGAAIKIFGGAGALFIIFYPQKRRFLVAALIATVILFLLPLIVTSFAQLHLQYQSWFAVLKADYFTRHNLSIMNWLHTWFGLTSPNPLFQFVGAAILLLPLLRRDCYADRSFRLRFLGSLLVFLLLLNHRAESPAFILAVAGVAIWYVAAETHLWRTVFALSVVFATSLVDTDVVPPHIRQSVVTPLLLKTFPCVIAWLVMQIDLLGTGRQKSPLTSLQSD
ncbi:MAG: hypothetical protein DME32_01525 [Verrucomicrobia bacterium]|nr:MAG: hypothetical protein DME32_01525 [Verrucomicrobiota bacterium]